MPQPNSSNTIRVRATDFDAVICGASLAGCTAAILLARAGWRVALVDRAQRMSDYKVLCSHHIHASATTTLHRLGLQDALKKVGALPNGMHAWTEWNWIREPLSNSRGWSTHGYNVRREVLDPLLREHAANTPGVTLLLGNRVETLLYREGRVAGVTVCDSAGAREIKAQLVIGADGSQSRVAKLANCRERINRNERVAYFAYYEGVQFHTPNDSLIWFGNPDYGFAFPNDAGVAQLGCYPRRELAARWANDPLRHFEAYLRSMPDFPDFDSTRRVTKLVMHRQLENIQRECIKPGLALIGDAALFSDPIWGSGCTWALQSAAWLADCVAPTLSESHDNSQRIDSALRVYARKHNRETRWHHFLISDYSTGRRFNIVERLIFAAAARDPKTAAHLNAYGSRLIGVGEFLRPGALGRAAWVNFRHLCNHLAYGAGLSRRLPQ